MDYPTLIREALLARENAYAPYSHFCVGAALLGKSGAVYRGCNVESVCLRSNQLRRANRCVQSGIRRREGVTAIAIVGGPDTESAPLAHTAFPCGICRQVLAEFVFGRSSGDRCPQL